MQGVQKAVGHGWHLNSIEMVLARGSDGKQNVWLGPSTNQTKVEFPSSLGLCNVTASDRQS